MEEHDAKSVLGADALELRAPTQEFCGEARQNKSVPTGFLHLPGELRNQIYKPIFEELVACPDHIAWDPLPSRSRFMIYLSLLLTSHQVKADAESMFSEAYAQRSIFYFRNVPSLYDFQQQAAHFPHLN